LLAALQRQALPVWLGLLVLPAWLVRRGAQLLPGWRVPLALPALRQRAVPGGQGPQAQRELRMLLELRELRCCAL